MSKLDTRAALVVFSGGQDSTTCLGWALDTFDTVAAITFDYGQRHAIEIEAAKKVLAFFEQSTGRIIEHRTVGIAGDVLVSTSPLTDRNAALETYTDHDSMEAIIGDRVEKTFVPMRNAVFLMIAANHAVDLGCANLVTGVCQADNANYPDCRDRFIASTAETINFALGTEGDHAKYGGFLIRTPLMYKSKAESVHFALNLPHTYNALAYSHTAYDGTYPPTSKDHASVLRAYGFEQAGEPDPLVMRAYREGVMSLPDTANYDVVREGGDPLPAHLVAHVVVEHDEEEE